MAFNLSNYLWSQAIRMLRDNWSTTRPFAQEWYTILRGIERETTGQLSFPPQEPGEENPFPPIEDLDIPPWDPDLPDEGPIVPDEDVQEDENGNITGTSTTHFWHRAVFPGLITGHAGGANYSITVYPNGELTSAAPNSSNQLVTKSVTARVTDESLAGTISNNSWVYVYWVVEYQAREETHRNSDGLVTSRQTQLSIVQEDWLFVAPASSGGGKVARVTETITARDGLTPGKGKAILYDFSKGGQIDPNTGEVTDPTLTEGEEVDVYNMVTSEIADGSDKFIQVNRVDNAWFISVEDCAAGAD